MGKKMNQIRFICRFKKNFRWTADAKPRLIGQRLIRHQFATHLRQALDKSIIGKIVST
jgi:hypothetical protein